MSIQDLAKRKVILVDANDNEIGETDLLDAHRGEGKLHRASSVFLFRKSPENPEKTELLIQQRSQEKIVGAGQWANTICGNLTPGENYAECALRRLKEELGITNISEKDLQKIEKFQYQVKCNEKFSENEIDQVFAGWWDQQKPSDLQENPSEVRQTKWVDWEKARSWINLSLIPKDLNLTPWFFIMLDRKSLIQKLDDFVKTLPKKAKQ